MSRPQPPKPRPGGRSLRKTAAAPDAPTAALVFRGTVALVRLSPPIPIASVRYDGVRLPDDRWRVAADGEVQIDCPSSAFDAITHRLQLASNLPGVVPLELSFRSDYRGAIEVADDQRIAGWLVDALRPGSMLAMDVACGDTMLRVHNTAKRPRLSVADAPAAAGGFDITLPPRPADTRPQWVTITIDGTNHQPFGPILRGNTLPAVVASAAIAAGRLGRSPEARLFGTVMLPILTEAWQQSALPSAIQLTGTQFLPRPHAPEIDVIVPVYRGAAETMACLASLLDGSSRIPHRIVVIDDCSPEPALSAALRDLAEAKRIHLLRNDSNLGFVASANRGMALSSTADVLLLNADTLAPPLLLDRLYRAAYADAAIATVTPLSNNATIVSLPTPPGDPADPWDLPYQEIDELCRVANAGVVRDIPSAHGFCMFIKRAAIDDIGMFDAAAFGTGYGEENDFSLRALLRGWRNVCAADIYVRHAGQVSFSTTAARDAQLAANLLTVQTRYPFYEALVADFLHTDPLHGARNAVQKAIWRQHERIAVFVTLQLDGGAARHSIDMMARLSDEGWLVLALVSERDADSGARLLLRRADRNEALRYPTMSAPEAALADILDLAPRFLHVQHVIDLPDGVAEFVRASGIPYAVTLHDFFYACPKVTLLDAGASYCGMPPATKCTLCVRQGPIHPQIHPDLANYAERGEIWRGKWEGLLRDAAQVIAPSHDTAARYAQLFPGLAVTVRPHFAPRDLRVPSPTSRRDGHTLRVALPGAIGPQKGVLKLIELARHCSRWDDDIEFVVVGHSDRDEELKRYSNVSLRGPYAPADAITALVESECRVALLLNVFPETFSYTLSESLQAGLTPVAYDFGAVGERMRALGVGVTVPPGAAPMDIVTAIRAAAQMRPHVAVDLLYAPYRELMSDYYAAPLTDLIAAAPPPDLPRILGRVRGLGDDGWCDSVVSWHLWSPRPLQRLAFDFWVPAEGQFQVVDIACNGTTVMRQPIEEGDVRRIVCQLAHCESRLLQIICTFDFLFPLQPPDVRSCSAMLSALHVHDGTGWLAVELLPAQTPTAATHVEAVA